MRVSVSISQRQREKERKAHLLALSYYLKKGDWCSRTEIRVYSKLYRLPRPKVSPVPEFVLTAHTIMVHLHKIGKYTAMQEGRQSRGNEWALIPSVNNSKDVLKRISFQQHRGGPDLLKPIKRKLRTLFQSKTG